MTTTHLTENFIEEMRHKLLLEQSRLKNELSGLVAHTEVGTQADENAEEVELDEVSQNLMGRIKADLLKIELALKKIEQGSYGIDDSGRPIAKERLEALPWADTAI